MEPVDLASPFTFDAKGEAAIVTQGTPPSRLSGAYNVCVCPEGFRDDLPEFGIPQMEFQTIPLGLKQLEEAILRWEPEASPELVESALEASQSSRLISIEVG
jgi:hypothetical protein